MKQSYEDVIHCAIRTDGLSRFGAFVEVVMPNSLASVLTAIVFALMLVTQESVYGVTLITSASSDTVSVGVPTFLVRGDVYFRGSMMGASVPIAIIYDFFVDRFVAGFTVGAVK